LKYSHIAQLVHILNDDIILRSALGCRKDNLEVDEYINGNREGAISRNADICFLGQYITTSDRKECINSRRE
jgi:hypothetical protein